jgi:hypothetical protein
MLTTWCAKLGIQEPKGLEIPEGFLGRLEQLVNGGEREIMKVVTLPTEH